MWAKKIAVVGLSGFLLLSGTSAFAEDAGSSPQAQPHANRLMKKAAELGIETGNMTKQQLKQAIHDQKKQAALEKLKQKATKLGVDADMTDMSADDIKDLIQNHKADNERRWVDEQAAKYGISRISADGQVGLTEDEFRAAVEQAYVADPANQEQLKKQEEKLAPIAAKLNIDTKGMNVFQIRQAIATRKAQERNNSLLQKAASYGIDTSNLSRSEIKNAIREAKQKAREQKLAEEAAQYGIDTTDMSTDEIKQAVHEKKKQEKQQAKGGTAQDQKQAQSQDQAQDKTQGQPSQDTSQGQSQAQAQEQNSDANQAQPETQASGQDQTQTQN